MVAEKTQDITLQQGETQPLVLRCETEPIVYVPITGITQTAPVRITAPAHGLVDGWRAAVTNVKGMAEINGEANKLKAADYHAATVVDGNTVEFNDVNAAGFKEYVSGGYLQFNTPMDLTGLKARLQVRNKKGGDVVLFEMTGDDGLIAIDMVLQTVTMYFDAVDLAAQGWKKGYYELELYKDMVRGAQTIPFVYSPLEGVITLEVETAK